MKERIVREGNKRDTPAKMKFVFGTLTILAVVLPWQKSRVLGELTVLQAEPQSFGGSNVMYRRLECISEDDSSAIVWIENLKYYNEPNSRIIFEDSSTKRSTINCAFDGKDDCFRGWNLSSNWKITNSYNTPMGPVMDRRWEGFPEFFFNASKSMFFERNHTGTSIFSIRGTVDLRIVFCVSSTPDSRCYWIAIGGRNGAESFIREFTGDIEFHDAQWIPGTECRTPQVSKHAEGSSSLVQWKTLTLKHSGSSKMVQVYDEEQLIRACNYTESITFNRIGLQSPTSMLTKVHDYEYYHTTVENEQLLSPWLDVVSSNICIEMVFGLCTECKLSINMMDEEGHQIMMGYAFSKSSLNGDGLPPWQRVRFNTSVQNNFGNRVRFQVLTHLLKDDPSPLWAVSNITKCKAGDAVRLSVKNKVQFQNDENKLTWPEVFCQKLSHNGGSLVSSNGVSRNELKPDAMRVSMNEVVQNLSEEGNGRIYPEIFDQKLSHNGGSLVSSNGVSRNELKHDVPWCEKGKVGPHCATNCSENKNTDCSKLSICLAEGCTCSQGWQGKNCDEEAPTYLNATVQANGVVILTWSYPWSTISKINQIDITIKKITSDLLQELSHETNSSNVHSIVRYKAPFTKRLYLLPSTKYNFSLCAEQIECIHEEASTPPALAFGSDLKIAGIQGDHTIQIELPSISHVTSDSHMHIILKGKVFCENRTTVSDVLTSLIYLDDSKSDWIVARFNMSASTVERERRIFTIGDSRTYNGIYNCPLNPGETYDIVVIVEGGTKPTENMTIISEVLQVKLPPEFPEPNLWLLSIPIIVALFLLICYAYRNPNVIRSMIYVIKKMFFGTMKAENRHVNPPESRRLNPPIPQLSEVSKHANQEEVENELYSK